MPDSSVDEQLAGATNAHERAAVFGYDFAVLKSDARRIYWRSLIAICIITVVLGLPVTFIVLFAESPGYDGELSSIDGNAALGASGFAVAAVLATIVATQVVLRLVRAWPPVRQQVVAASVQAGVESVGFAVAVTFTRSVPDSIVGLIFGCIFIAAFRAITTTSIVTMLERGSAALPFVMGQLRTLPAEATVLGGRPWATVLLTSTGALAVFALVIALWSHPVLAVPIVIVYTTGLTLEAGAFMTGRATLAQVCRWTVPVLLLLSAALPAF